MIAVDTNILVYAHRRDMEWHASAAGALARLAEGAATWAIPWSCVHEFVAIVTHSRIFRTPSAAAAALAQVEAWLESPTLVVLNEGPTYWPRFRTLVDAARVAGARIHDARIAAVCLDHGVDELWSADRDFGRFPDLKVVNPLQRPT